MKIYDNFYGMAIDDQSGWSIGGMESFHCERGDRRCTMHGLVGES